VMGLLYVHGLHIKWALLDVGVVRRASVLFFVCEKEEVILPLAFSSLLGIK